MKKLFRFLFFTLLILIIFKGILYRTLVNYSVIITRTNIKLTDGTLCAKIDKKTKEKTLTIAEIITLSNSITSDHLSFTFNKTSSNPNTISKDKKANCIGYAALFNSIGNYILEEKQLSDSYRFSHLVGKLDVLGFDIHSLINNPFFKDHDFNKVKNLKTNDTYFIDPSLSDYLYIDSVTCN